MSYRIKTCLYCNKSFGVEAEDKRSKRSLYCTDLHRKFAWKQRHWQEYLAWQRKHYREKHPHN